MFDHESLVHEIQVLIAGLDEESVLAMPEVERAAVQKIRLLLDATREERLTTGRAAWETYLPFAAALCTRLSRLEPGWEDELDFFASENAQFWVDLAAARLDAGDIPGTRAALGQVVEASRLVKADFILRADLLLRALELALELSERRQAVRLYEEAEKVYRGRLLQSEQYAGSLWAGRIKKIGNQLEQHREKLRRFYGYSEAVSFTIEADTPRDLERVIETLQESLGSRVKVTRRPPEGKRARVKITVDGEA